MVVIRIRFTPIYAIHVLAAIWPWMQMYITIQNCSLAFAFPLFHLNHIGVQNRQPEFPSRTRRINCLQSRIPIAPLIPLCASKQRSTGNRPACKRSTQKGNKHINHKKETTAGAVTPKPAKSPSTSSKPSPPWRVLSTKEAQKNVEMEKARRDKIQKGTPEDPSKLHQQRELLKSKTTLSKTFLSDPEKRLLNWKRFNPSTVQLGQRFVGAYIGNADIPPLLGVPEIAFLGRSNVGKSSCLNVLSSMSTSSSTSSNIRARVGKTPGATASVNMYAMFNSRKKSSASPCDVLAWVDMPGFGYAQLSKSTQERIQKVAEQYLESRRQSSTNALALAILLVDIRRNPSDDDRGVLAALYDRNIPVLVVATKVDKTTTNERLVLLRAIQDGLGLPEGLPLCISSVTLEGVKMLWNIILEACETHVAELKSRYVDDQVNEEDEEENDMTGVEEEEDDEFFDDSDDLMYDQGYDWVHSSMEIDENFDDFDHHQENLNTDTIFDDNRSRFVDSVTPPPQETFRSLQKKARKMEKRGQV